MIQDHIFSEANRLKDYSLTIGEVYVSKQLIGSIEIVYSQTPVVRATVLINDIIDLNVLTVWRDSEVVIKYTDVFDEFFEKTFIIISLNEFINTNRDKSIVLELQDKVSYVLENSHLSKSFKDNPTSAFNKYLEKLEINSIIGSELLLTDVEESYNFVVPKNINNLAFFTNEFRKHGFVLYQNKTNLILNSLEDLDVEFLPYNGIFIDETNNQLFKDRIIKIDTSFNNRKDILPTSRSIYYNFDSKTILFSEPDDITVYSVNSDVFTLQGTNGVRDVLQSHSDFNEHILDIKDSMFKQSTAEIVVNGYCKNDLYQQYELKLKGLRSNTASQVNGTLVSGIYTSSKIVDKIIGDSMIQKISLCRTDLNKGKA